MSSLPIKNRVFQVARELNISNEAVIEFLKKQGHDIRNHMSPLSEEMYAQVVQKFGEGSAPVKVEEEQDFRKKIREKMAHEKERVLRAKEELELRLKYAQEVASQLPKLKQSTAHRDAARPSSEAPARTEPFAPSHVEKPAEPPKVEKPARPKKKIKIVEIPVEEGRRRPKEKAEIAPELPADGVPIIIPAKSTPPKVNKVEAPGVVVPLIEPKAKAEVKPEAEKDQKKKKKKSAVDELIEQDVTEYGDRKRKKGKKKKRKVEFDEAEIEENIRATLAAIDEAGRPKRRKKRVQEEEGEEVEVVPVIRVSEFISLSELAKLMEVESSELIKKCMELGMMVSINQRLDMDTITLLASEYEYQVESLDDFGQEYIEELTTAAEEDELLVARAPVVTIMGHVDHGKTSLLDYIRESNIISGESGGITQHIGAYEVNYNSKKVTFLDTPGHEAFTAMRARGAQITDIVVLVVAADDNVMPQTIEAISHAKAATVPIIVAINKIDKPNANPDLIRHQLADHGVLVEQWGGKYQSVEISAKTGQNVEQLLEMILVEAEVLDLKANPDRLARGVVIESSMEKGRGIVATVLVQNGTLKISDPFVAGAYSGKVRSMFDERGHRQKFAFPAQPVQVLGFDGMPTPGDSLVVLESERDTKEISYKRQQLQREYDHWRSRPRTLDEISRQIQKGQIKKLSVILKADVDGSVEAIGDSLLKLATQEVAVDLIHKGVGAISESDVLLASASEAIIIGFNVRPTIKARELAAKESVDIRSYDVIYDIIDDVKAALEGFLEPTRTEQVVATLEVRQIFRIPKIGVIAGCYIQTGRFNRNDKIKLYRDDRLIHDGKISSLKRFKEDIREVASGFECGLGIDRFDDVKVNDIIEAYQIVETKRTLS